ncbi:hypothetical protein [Amycolatopsis sp. NPDC059021]|uniref:hypothetical protein n=1 Tax=Amycolatopsis sp. NPDC059021 TaxID=3346704 RepID=UPI0036711957
MPVPLSREVLAVLDRLLPADDPVAAGLRAQLPHARMSPGCECGCATVHLHVATGEVAPVESPRREFAAARVEAADGTPRGGILLLVDGGYLSWLEIYSYDAPIGEWPSPCEVHPDG